MSGIVFPEPPLSDDVVTLRPWRDEHASVKADWGQDPVIVRWTGVPANYTEAAALARTTWTEDARKAGQSLALAITDAASGAVLGSCDIRRPDPEDPALGEVGYLLSESARGRGVATRAMRLLIAWSFRELGMARVQALVHPDNPRSAAVLDRVGFQREGLLRRYRAGEAGREDRILYSVLPHELAGRERSRSGVTPEDARRRLTLDLPTRHELRDAIPWVDGHADVWHLFADHDLFRRCVLALVAPYRDDRITHVVAIESRGFVLGGAAAKELGAGFVAIRKAAGHLPGDALYQDTAPDYKGSRGRLRLQAGALTAGARVLVVDDWFETGSQFRAARALLDRAGASFVGASVIVDETPPVLRPLLGKFSALIRADELSS